MQLNNKNNHEIITIDKIDVNQNFVVFSRYEKNNGILLETKRIQCTGINLREKLQECINYFELIYNHLPIHEKDFEVSNDVQNWKLADRSIRIIIPQKLVNLALIEQNALNTIIQRELASNASATEKFLFQAENIAICYFYQVSNDDAPIIQPYIESGEIILETKQS